jgi:hypothetical protein
MYSPRAVLPTGFTNEVKTEADEGVGRRPGACPTISGRILGPAI